MIPEPTWICSVWAVMYAKTVSGADMWEYSVRAWCSPSHAYFQLNLSAWMA